MLTAAKSQTITESPSERHVHGEEASKPVDRQPKKHMNQTATQRHSGNHRNDGIGKDRNKPVRSQAGRECAG